MGNRTGRTIDRRGVSFTKPRPVVANIRFIHGPQPTLAGALFWIQTAIGIVVELYEDISLGVLTMQSRISVDPRIHFGKPCLSGTRIPVQNVLELVREGLTFAQITSDYYPDLNEDDVRACVQYAMDVLAMEELHLAPAP